MRPYWLLLAYATQFVSSVASTKSGAKSNTADVSEDTIKGLGFMFDAKNPLPIEELRKITDPMKKALASDPFAIREKRRSSNSSEFVDTSETNLQFVSRRRDKNAEANRRYYDRTKDKRVRKFNKQPLRVLHSTVNAQNRARRISEALQGSRDDPMMLRDSKGVLRPDRQRRTKGQYLSEYHEKARNMCKDYYWTKKGRERKAGVPANPSRAQSPHLLNIDLNKAPSPEA